MIRLVWWVLGTVLVLSSCVPNRKYIYLQHQDVKVKNLPKDSVVRTYNTDVFDYRVQPHDALFVRFESATDKQFDFLSADQGNLVNVAQAANLASELVDEQGEIRFPVIGKVKVVGLTIFEIEEKLQELADQYLEEVKVRVRLVNFRFSVLGEVPREGISTSFNNRVTVPEAIAMAGGLGELADRSNIKLIRQLGNDVEVAYIDLLDENFIHSPYYYIHQNDVLIVPALDQRPFRRYFGQNLSLFISSLSLLLLVINLNR